MKFMNLIDSRFKQMESKFNAHVSEGVTSESATADPDVKMLNGRMVLANT